MTGTGALTRLRGLGDVREDLRRHDLDLVRAWPRGPQHLLLHVRATGGRHGDGPGWTAGQWFADDDRAATVARASRHADDRPAATHLRGTGVVLQPAGADRRLVGLRPLLRDPAAELVAHRPERRAVVTDRDRQLFTKVVTPSRVDALVASASWRPDGVAVPDVVAVDRAAGTVSTAALSGRTLHELGSGSSPLPATATSDEAHVRSAWRAAGAAVAALHAGPPPPGARHHGVADEADVTRTWLERACRHRSLAPERVARLWAQARAATGRLAGDAPTRVTVHRDLHDKQVVVDLTTGAAALLDLDLVAVGEPALDLANLLVHLMLRDEQAALAGTGLPPNRRAPARAQAFLDGYGDLPHPDRVRDLAVLAAVRVAAVYSYREPLPATADAGRRDGAADVGGPELGVRLLGSVDAWSVGVC